MQIITLSSLTENYIIQIRTEIVPFTVTCAILAESNHAFRELAKVSITASSPFVSLRCKGTARQFKDAQGTGLSDLILLGSNYQYIQNSFYELFNNSKDSFISPKGFGNRINLIHQYKCFGVVVPNLVPVIVQARIQNAFYPFELDFKI